VFLFLEIFYPKFLICVVIVCSEQDQRRVGVESTTVVSTDMKSEDNFSACVNSDLTLAAEEILIIPVRNKQNPLISDTSFNSRIRPKKRSLDRKPLLVAFQQDDLNKKIKLSDGSDVASGNAESVEMRAEMKKNARRLRKSLYKRKPNRGSYVCTICGRVMVTKLGLSVHIRSHTLERPYKCNVCTKGFTSSSNLQTHLRRHSKLRPHLCEICGKGFNQNSNLQSHMSQHGPEKLVECEQCGQSFNSLNQKKSFLCDLCGRSFTSYYTLRAHSKVHTGERLFQCKFCDESFEEKQHLYDHTRSHVNGRSFVCVECDKSFAFKNCLAKHVKTFHCGEKINACTSCGHRIKPPPVVLSQESLVDTQC